METSSGKIHSNKNAFLQGTLTLSHASSIPGTLPEIAGFFPAFKVCDHRTW